MAENKDLRQQQGKYNYLFFRLLSEAGTKTGVRLALQTDHSVSSSANSQSAPTKDGPIVQTGTPEVTVTANSIMQIGDPLQKMLKHAHETGEVVEVWNVYTDPQTMTTTSGSKQPAQYMQGYITSYNESSPSEGNVTLSYTIAINQIPQDGQVTITADQAKAIQYEFRTLEKVTQP